MCKKTKNNSSVDYCHFFLILGGWQADGKGPSIWDTFCHEEGRVCGAQTGDVTCNSYELWEKDLKCIQQLGLTHYRFSLSWARLLPDGTKGNVNQKGTKKKKKKRSQISQGPRTS